MTALPERLSETGKNAALFKWLNMLRDCVMSQRAMPSNQMRVMATKTGTVFESQPKQNISASQPGEATWL
jgi:hypothetical protein